MKRVGIRAIAPLAIMLVLLPGCGSDQPGSGAESAERTPLGENEHQRDFGKYRMHVNALTTDQLTPEVAKSYGLARSKNRGMLNIVITRKQDDTDEAVSGVVTATARNLAGQLRHLDMRQVVEKEAVYFIGEFAVTGEETLVFDVDVTPAGADKPYLLTYRHQFFGE